MDVDVALGVLAAELAEVHVDCGVAVDSFECVEEDVWEEVLGGARVRVVGEVTVTQVVEEDVGLLLEDAGLLLLLLGCEGDDVGGDEALGVSLVRGDTVREVVWELSIVV